MSLDNESIFKIIIDNKQGFTVDVFSLEKLRTGFIVGLTNYKFKYKFLMEKGYSEILKHHLEDIENVLSSLNFNFDKYKFTLGGWYNEQDRFYYLDLGVQIEDLDKALFVGDLFKQEAIFCLDNNKELYLKDKHYYVLKDLDNMEKIQLKFKNYDEIENYLKGRYYRTKEIKPLSLNEILNFLQYEIVLKTERKEE